MSTLKEADITISGVPLTAAQSLTVRAAIQSFSISLASGKFLGLDQTGKDLSKGYQQRIAEINQGYQQRIAEINQLLFKSAP